jgi:cobalt-zinc-cadmium efflux system membrane fusion protein
MNRNFFLGFAVAIAIMIAAGAASYGGWRFFGTRSIPVLRAASGEGLDADEGPTAQRSTPTVKEGQKAAAGQPVDDCCPPEAAATGKSASEGAEAEAECHDEVVLTSDTIAQNGITFETARKETLSESATVPGRVSYNTEAMAHVGTPVQGRIVDVRARLGDVVKKGDTLFVIDSPALGEAQSDFLQKRTQIQVAESAVAVAKTSADRARQLLEGQGISLAEFQKRDGEYKAANGTRLTAQAALTAAENKLHLWGMGQIEIDRLIATGEIRPQYTVRAPMGGCVVQREATLGEIVSPEREALLVMADLKTIWVLADVPENQLHRIEVGVPAEIAVDAIAGQPFQGAVTYIGPELDKATRTGQVRVEIAGDKSPLKPGMFAQVRLPLSSRSGGQDALAVAVPEIAVQTFEGGPTVFVAVEGEPDTYGARKIEIGPAIGGRVPILKGLAEGERFVAGGSFIVKAQLAKGLMEGKTCTGH